MADIKIYLTSLEPDMEQTIYSQSIGGHISNSLLYPETTLSDTVALYDASLYLNTPSSGSWSEWQGVEYINIGQEVIKVNPITNGSIKVVQRGYNGIVNMHLVGDVVRAVSASKIFNDIFNEDRKQYRCIALKNTSSVHNPSDIKFSIRTSIYVSQSSLNSDSSIKIAVEMPKSRYLQNTSTKWSSSYLKDSTLAGQYADNHFKDAYLKIVGGSYDGQGRLISSYDGSTGTFVFYSSMPSTYNYTTNVSYEVLPAPAQRIKSGLVSPSATSSFVTPFYVTSKNSPISLKVGGNSGILYPNDICYLWIEREIVKGASSFDSNFITINLSYNTTG